MIKIKIIVTDRQKSRRCEKEKAKREKYTVHRGRKVRGLTKLRAKGKGLRLRRMGLDL